MSCIRKLSGKLVATGPVVHHGVHTGSIEPGSVYDYLRFEGPSGEGIYVAQVTVPAFLDSLLVVGAAMTISMAEIRMPTLWGSNPMQFLYAIRVGGKTLSAVQNAQRILDSMRGAALRLFLYGLILLPAWGAGLLFWFAALRITRLKLPIDKMVEDGS